MIKLFRAAIVLIVFISNAAFAQRTDITIGMQLEPPHSWQISEDGLTYTFAINDGIKFHDGSRLDANDVKFSLDRSRSEKSTNAQKQLFANIKEIAVEDPQTLVITLSAPTGALLFNLAWGDAVVMSPDTFDQARTPSLLLPTLH